MDIKKEREVFEKFCFDQFLMSPSDGCFELEDDGFYESLETHRLWQLWQLKATAQAAPEWISVNDKMPDEGDEVFVHHYGHIVQATKDQKYSGGFKQRNCYGWEAVSSYISHWMPMSVVLPESYHFYYGKPAKKAQEPAND